MVWIRNVNDFSTLNVENGDSVFMLSILYDGVVFHAIGGDVSMCVNGKFIEDFRVENLRSDVCGSFLGRRLGFREVLGYLVGDILDKDTANPS